MEEIVNKTRFHCFFISYDNMNFYEHVRDQRLHNRSAIVNYTAGYICLMKTSEEGREDDTWLERYIDSTQIDRRLVNAITNEDFDLTQRDHDHRSAANRYILSEVLGQYFSGSMYKQENTQVVSIYQKWETPLPNIRCRNEAADILPLPTLPFNEESIAGTIDILREIAKRLGLSEEVVRDKIILLKGDLLTVRNCRRAIYRRQGEQLPSSRFHWLELPVAGLFHLQINFLSMLFDRFWGVAGDIVSLNHYAGILKRKYVTKAADNNHFYHSDDFLRTVMEALVITLCMQAAGCSTIESFHAWIEKSDRPSLIGNVEQSCLGVTRVRSIQDKAFTRTNAAVAAALRAKKEQWANLEDQSTEPNWVKIEKDLLSEISPTNRDVVRENALLLLNYGLLYLDFNDACCKGYSGRVEKCIACLAVIYQGSHQTKYSMKLIHMVACMKRIWKDDLK